VLSFRHIQGSLGQVFPLIRWVGLKAAAIMEAAKMLA
jgi:hypothetical protein